MDTSGWWALLLIVVLGVVMVAGLLVVMRGEVEAETAEEAELPPAG